MKHCIPDKKTTAFRLGVAVLGPLFILAIGGCGSKEADKGPLHSDSPGFHACADGTVYMIGQGSLLLWLVKGKAVKVACNDDFSETALLSLFSDTTGGMYLMGTRHLWYVKGGKATKVSEVPLAQVDADQHQVSKTSLLWSLLERFSASVFWTGYNNGLENAPAE